MLLPTTKSDAWATVDSTELLEKAIPTEGHPDDLALYVLGSFCQLCQLLSY